jgi:hypothetical protein
MIENSYVISTHAELIAGIIDVQESLNQTCYCSLP